MDFNCEVTADGLKITLGKHEGSYPAWWRQIHIEVYGWSSREHTARIDGKNVEVEVSSSGNIALTIPDNETGSLLELK
jgi:alpha-glucosidase